MSNYQRMIKWQYFNKLFKTGYIYKKSFNFLLIKFNPCYMILDGINKHIKNMIMKKNN